LERINAGINDGWRRCEGSSLSAAECASAVLGNGLGRYEQVLGAAQRASEDRSVPPFSNWALAELVEAAARTGNGEAAADAADRRTRAQTQHRDHGQANRPGGSDRAAYPRRPLQYRDRRAAVHQPAHRRLPPPQGVQQARHHLAQPTRRGAARDRECGSGGVAVRPPSLRLDGWPRAEIAAWAHTEVSVSSPAGDSSGR